MKITVEQLRILFAAETFGKAYSALEEGSKRLIEKSIRHEMQEDAFI